MWHLPQNFRINPYGRLALDTQILVVATIVYVLLGNLAGGHLCLKPLKPLGAVERILLLRFFRK